MPLHLLPAPAPAERSIHAALRSPVPMSPLPAALRQDPESLRPVLPLPVYRLSSPSAAGALPRTKLTAWRFLLARDNRAVGAAEARLTADGWTFSHFSEGPYIASSETALHQAEELPADLQPRLLSVPQLYMLTLWLHGDITSPAAKGRPDPADVLMPLAPAPPGIAPGLPMRADALPGLLSRRLSPPAEQLAG
ncbi:hypothetical protein [Streptomyces sp. YIM 98790]|uniref:hypothetical protein n=1 Tax=Streptomyces sp. YIM 98790 TaxID=2689077 RepID=UPI00140B092E|nr:hypothetical protein [Streptomyces sp. YIM 98790]